MAIGTTKRIRKRNALTNHSETTAPCDSSSRTSFLLQNHPTNIAMKNPPTGIRIFDTRKSHQSNKVRPNNVRRVSAPNDSEHKALEMTMTNDVTMAAFLREQ